MYDIFPNIMPPRERNFRLEMPRAKLLIGGESTELVECKIGGLRNGLLFFCHCAKLKTCLTLWK